ncbi:MAG: carboxy-S-adenosyl-L-methionine synthase CmoA [Chitinophagaceae bacterium]|nr:carboxy-S-adenosyl-L-methionine synthase CmoA [Chitinophagaceae bacterium]
MRDQVFSEEIPKAKDFAFNAGVADVFDDMVNRSVPFYEEMQRMIAELAASHAVPFTNVYDLGCSTGTTIVNMSSRLKPGVKVIGIDDSEEMLKKCKAKLDLTSLQDSYELHCADISGGINITNASVAILCLTLQFVRPLHREALLKDIYNGLNNGGVLILVEKILAENSAFNRSFINYYYDYKRRNQYSELEISQKREALENVLIPYRLSENICMLNRAGFLRTELFFKWYNFSGLIAVKE